MNKLKLLLGSLVAAIVLLFAGEALWTRLAGPPESAREPGPGTRSTSAARPSTPAETHSSLLYGRVVAQDGTVYEGRLRWGVREEAFWGDYFNGFKKENPWIAHAPPEARSRSRTIRILGVEVTEKEEPIDLGRPFMARFGDIAKIEAVGGIVRVTLKSGTVFDLDRFAAGDFDDGLRVWDGERGALDLESRQIRTIEFLPAARPGPSPDRLHGTVRTADGAFTGFVQWNREACLGDDELNGRGADGKLGLRFDTIGSIARRVGGGSLVTLLDGRELVLRGTREVDDGNLGVYVDEPRYGRVLVPWDAFQRIDFGPGGEGPAYDDFPPGHPLSGRVTTRAGSRLAGRLVFDLDESETVETLDAPSRGVDYTIPFGLITSITNPGSDRPVTVTLNDGEELQLERSGDLGDGNAGMLIFVDDRPRPEFVPWTDVARIAFDRPEEIAPPLE